MNKINPASGAMGTLSPGSASASGVFSPFSPLGGDRGSVASQAGTLRHALNVVERLQMQVGELGRENVELMKENDEGGKVRGVAAVRARGLGQTCPRNSRVSKT